MDLSLTHPDAPPYTLSPDMQLTKLRQLLFEARRLMLEAPNKTAGMREWIKETAFGSALQ